jgi:hypothetical protein
MDPIFLPVLQADMAAHIGTIHLDLTGQRRFRALHYGTLANLVHPHEGGLVLHSQAPAHLQADRPLTALA